MTVLEPASADEAAVMLQQAARDGKRVALRGGGTKSTWGTVSRVPEITLSTLRLDRVVAHRHGDLTATVEAGATLEAVNRHLAAHRQWIPLDPPWSDRATIGGIVATNDSGPRRHRYGAPRDLIIGVEIVRPDGVRAKAGGIVVKNVAGYDLARLMTGSFGSLAVITSATFKLYPLAPSSRTVVIDVSSHAAAAAIAGGLNASQLTPTALEIQAPPLRLLVRFESTAASVDVQSAAAATIARTAGGTARIIDGEEEHREWRAHAERPWNGDGAIVKITLLPADLGAALDTLHAERRVPVEVAGRAGLGVLLARLGGDVDARARLLNSLRSRCPASKGSVAVLRGGDGLPRSAPASGAEQVMNAVRSAFDPSGLLANRQIE